MILARWRPALSLAVLAVVPATAAVANSEPAIDRSTAGASVSGRAIYNFRCYYCHGYSGNGRTVAATYLSPPPADFTGASSRQLTVAAIEMTLRAGRPGTAMKSFATVISEAEIRAVAEFVHEEFVVRKAENTRYHTEANGWPDHGRYYKAFPFATGEIGIAVPWEALSAEQAEGKRLYMSSCVTCHDRGDTASSDKVVWDARPVSYPRNNFSFTQPPKLDAMTSASPYVLHDRLPVLKGLSPSERRGGRLFQENCAFCHGADGTGKNWIGSFLEPHPRNLTDPRFMLGMTRERLATLIEEGLPETSMPAWKSVLSSSQIRALVDYIAKAFHSLPRWGSEGTPRPSR